MKASEEQIKDFLGLFKILFSGEELKEIKEDKDKEFVKTVVNKIDGFLTETFKEIKIMEKCKYIKIYYIADMKKLKQIKEIELDRDDHKVINNKIIHDSHKKIFEKYLKLLSDEGEGNGYYIGVFEDVK